MLNKNLLRQITLAVRDEGGMIINGYEDGFYEVLPSVENIAQQVYDALLVTTYISECLSVSANNEDYKFNTRETMFNEIRKQIKVELGL